MDGAERMRRWRAEQVRAGAKIVHGRVVWEPRLIRPKGTEPPHGTTARYGWKADPCRCAECRQANTDYGRQYKARRRAEGRP